MVRWFAGGLGMSERRESGAGCRAPGIPSPGRLGAEHQHARRPSPHLCGGALPPAATVMPRSGLGRRLLRSRLTRSPRVFPRWEDDGTVKGGNSPKIEYWVYRKCEHTSKYLTTVAATYHVFKPLSRIDVFECTFCISRGLTLPFSPGERGIHLDRR